MGDYFHKSTIKKTISKKTDRKAMLAVNDGSPTFLLRVVANFSCMLIGTGWPSLALLVSGVATRLLQLPCPPFPDLVWSSGVFCKYRIISL